MQVSALHSQSQELRRLTGHDGSGAVLLSVAVLEPDGAGARFCLVRTQRLPLLLQAVLVLQVILHVRLKEEEETERRRWL